MANGYNFKVISYIDRVPSDFENPPPDYIIQDLHESGGGWGYKR